MKPDQVNKMSGSNTIVYGPPFSGKTALVGDLANHGFNLVWFDLEQGAETLALVIDEENYRNIDIIQVLDTPEKPSAIQAVAKFFAAKTPMKFCELHGSIGCVTCTKDGGEFLNVDKSTFTDKTVVVFDSLTQLSISSMNHTLGVRQVMQTKKVEWDNYGDQGQLLDYILGHAKACPYKTIFISHESSIEQEDGLEKLTPVAGTRNYSRNAAKNFTHTVYCDKKNNKHVCYSSSTANNKILTGSRSGIAIEDGNSLADLLCPDPELQKKAKADFRSTREKAREALTKLKSQSPAQATKPLTQLKPK